MSQNRKPFYIERTNWKAEGKRGTPPALQDVFELPKGAAGMDAEVKSRLCDLLASPKAAGLRDALQSSVRALETHSTMGWGLTFRATYMFAWCHDLAWFAMAPSSAPQLVTVRTPFKRTCHVCESGGFGFKRPSQGFGKKSDGDLLANPPIPSPLRLTIARVRNEIRGLRSNGTLDPVMRDVAKGVERLGRSINAYYILPILQFDDRGERVAISNDTWLSPGVEPEGPAADGQDPGKYFAPCPWCRGSGSEY